MVERLRREAEDARAEAQRQQQELETRLESVETAKAALMEDARKRVARPYQRHCGPTAAGRNECWTNPKRSRNSSNSGKRCGRCNGSWTSTAWQPIEVKLTPWHERLKEGDRVYVRGIGHPVEVITPPGGQDRVEVLLGTMRAKIPVYQLERQADSHPVATRRGVYLSRAPTAAPHRPGTGPQGV